MSDDEKKSVPLGESYDFLRKSMDYLQIQQSSGSAAPSLYPEANGQTGEVQPGPLEPQPPTRPPDSLPDTSESD